MNRETVKLLLVDDNDVHCKPESELTLDSLNFIPKDLEKFDLIVYNGRRGTKILKSKYFQIGEIKNKGD